MIHLNNNSGNTFYIPTLLGVTDLTGNTSYLCKLISDQSSDYSYFVINSGYTNVNFDKYTITLTSTTGTSINQLTNKTEGQYTMYIYSQTTNNSLDINTISRLIKILKVQINNTADTKVYVNLTDTKIIVDL